jgi:ferric-dicitrate binding protein FerR (iron transport regulator)
MNKIDWEILANHLTGQAADEEQKKLAEWLAGSAENRDFYERLKKVWLAEHKAPPRLDTEKALRLVMSRIQQPSLARQRATPRIRSSFIRRPISEFMTRPYFLRAAAALAVAIGVFTILTSKRDLETSSVTFATVQTLQLPDGTRITFDVGSSFKYPKSFDGADTREVFFDGEAYFEVTRDDELPFTIHANGGSIKVLGTSFAVRAWRSDEHIVVAVKEGRVSFQPEANDDTSKIVYLTQNTMSKLSRTEKTPTPAERIDFSTYVSWMKKEIYFQNTPVPEVLRQLERWYNVSIQTADSSMAHGNITVFIGNKPLNENLNLLSLILNMKFEQRSDTVRFVPR